MTERPWRHYVSLFTDEPLTIEPAKLVVALEKALADNGFPGPYNTETNAPGNEDGAPVVKVETANSEAGVWTGNHLIFMPIGSDGDIHKLFNALSSTELSGLVVDYYSLSSSKIIILDKDEALQSENPSMKDLVANEASEEFSVHSVQKIDETLTAKDIIKVSRGEKTDRFTIDLSVRIEGPSLVGNPSVSSVLPEIESAFIKLKAHEDGFRKQATRTIGQ